MKYCIILLLFPIVLNAQKLSVKEYYGECILIKKDTTMNITQNTRIDLKDEISIPEDAYLVLVSEKNGDVEIPLSTGKYSARDIATICKTDDSSILLFFRNVYAYFKEDNPQKAQLVSGAVTRSDCIYTLEKGTFEVVNKCKKGSIRIIDASNDEEVNSTAFNKKTKKFEISLDELGYGLYAIDIGVKDDTLSYLIRKEENQKDLENLNLLKALYNEELIQFYRNQNCIWPFELDLESEFKTLSK